MPSGPYQPTDAQLEVLNVLWDLGPSTVREVHEALHGNSERTYTTTLKTLQVMTERGLVARDDSRRSHVYRPCWKRNAVQRSLLAELRRKAFGGSATSLALHALSGERATAQEIAAIRELLDQMEGTAAEDSNP